MAEGVGFEPTAPFGVTGFQDQLLKPLGHPSNRNYQQKQNIVYHKSKVSVNPGKRPGGLV
jgi:hypothetical protein